MSLFKLARNNIKHNLKSYIVYFFAMCFSVFTTYSFLALIFSDNYASQSFAVMFSVFGIIILAFIFFFLMSSNKSFIRARKQEISTYALLGMDTRRIGRLLFLETLILGSVALIVGIALGIFFSKLIAMILINMTLADYSGDVTFSISRIAVYITIGIFFIIFCFMGSSGHRVINKFNLVDLFKASKVSEKRSKGSYVMLILSLALIGCGYYWAWSLSAMKVLGMLVTILLVVVLGTHMFFWGGFQKLLHLLKGNKRHFYKDANLISLSFLSHRAKTIATTMATIAILVASGTTAVSFGYTLFQSAGVMTYHDNGYDVSFVTDDAGVIQGVTDIINKHDIKLESISKVDAYMVTDKEVDFPITKGAYVEDKGLGIISESQYNALIQEVRSDATPMDITKGEVTVGYNPNMMGKDWKGAKLVFEDRELPVTKVDGFAYRGGRMVLIIMDDGEFEDLRAQGEITPLKGAQGVKQLVGVNYPKALEQKAVATELKAYLKQNASEWHITYFDYTAILGFFGQICFIGFFMCIMLILMTASMLYFKQVTMAAEEKTQYMTLRRLGIGEAMEKKAIRKRLLPVFVVPLLIGIVHSLFAMKAADTMFFTNMFPIANSYMAVLKTSAIMYIAYIAVYGIFYIVTKNQYNRILNK